MKTFRVNLPILGGNFRPFVRAKSKNEAVTEGYKALSKYPHFICLEGPFEVVEGTRSSPTWSQIPNSK